MGKSAGLLIVAAIGLFLIMSGCGTYNSLVTKDETVNQAWGNVQSAYQRRNDLIGNLVETVKGAANFEKETLVQITEARAKATSTTVNLDKNSLTPEGLKQFQEAQAGLSSALSRLLVSVEKYPDLKATDNFKELQAQLEGTENRIKVERDKFNEVVTDYNISVRRFPAALFAGIFGFQTRAQFEAEDGAQNAPKVNFDFGK
ncbi:MAG: LemA family protein [Saprospiraceae bacterium]|nr:LemA family protein [Saprospiraceae bacterium]